MRTDIARLLYEARLAEPFRTDISDHGDEWCAGFLAGQHSLANEIEAEIYRDLNCPSDQQETE